ncbi:MAG: MFS transporter [Anaerolineae bacterium]|nr:MFS transporter [Anaerolineae bacterium]
MAQAQKTKADPQNLTRMYGVGVMAFIIFLSNLVAVPVLPQLARELGASSAEIPIVVSAALATVVLVQFFTGILADRYARRTLILIGTLIGSVSSLLCVVATHWLQLTALRVAGGIADAIAMPALLAITATLGTDQPGKFFGILRGSQGLSVIAGPALGSVFSLVSLRTPFVVDGLFSLVAFVAAIGLLRDTGRVKSEHSLSVFYGLRSVFADKRVYLYLLLGISGMFSFGIFYSFVPTKSQVIGLSAWHIGLILSSGALIFSFVSYSVGALSDRWGRRAFAIVAQVFIVVSGMGLWLSHGFAGILIWYALFCVGETISYLLSFVYATDAFDPKYIGVSMGAFDSLMDLSLFIGPLLAVIIYSSTGQFGPVFIIAVGPAILTLFATVVWLPDRAKQLPVIVHLGE